MSKRILWLDNDPTYIKPYVEALENQGYILSVVKTVIEAEQRIIDETHALLILDVMIPTKGEDEEKIYKPEDTASGLKTGLQFYRRLKDRLSKGGTQVLVLTVRLDKRIAAEFMEAGLPRDCYATKMTLREVPAFLTRVKSLLNE